MSQAVLSRGHPCYVRVSGVARRGRFSFMSEEIELVYNKDDACEHMKVGSAFRVGKTLERRPEPGVHSIIEVFCGECEHKVIAKALFVVEDGNIHDVGVQ